MGKYAELQEAQKASKELKKLKKEMMAKYFCDLSKLTFTAMVLGGIISFFQDTSFKWGIVIVLGFVMVVELVGISNYILKS